MTVTGLLEGDDILNEEDTEYFLDEDGSRPFPGFAEKLVDMKLEETKEFSLTIPDDFSDAKMAGKEVQFTVSVSDAKERKLPELDDEFAKARQLLGYESIFRAQRNDQRTLLGPFPFAEGWHVAQLSFC